MPEVGKHVIVAHLERLGRLHDEAGRAAREQARLTLASGQPDVPRPATGEPDGKATHGR